MRDFFCGWRRKIGVVTLVLACVFMAEWVRSQTIEDEIIFGSGEGKSFHSLTSSRYGIKWQKDASDGVRHWLTGWRCNSIESTGPHEPTRGYVDPQVIDWRWELYGIDLGRFHDQTHSTSRVSWWLVPYWSIVIPLTLLSASLLLSKPRPAKKSQLLPPEPFHA